MNKGGRPPIIDEIVLQKLEMAFSIDCTDSEACFYAGICPATLYNYQTEHPEFLERKEGLKNKPVLKARQTVVSGLDQVNNAQWYLERKKKNEFAQRNEMDHSGAMQIQIINYQDDNHSPQLSSTAIPTPLPEESGTVQDTDIPSASREVSDTPERTDPEGESY
jgi:hypothetical protein